MIVGGNIYGYDQTLASRRFTRSAADTTRRRLAIGIVLLGLILILMCGLGLLQHQGSGIRLRFRTAT